MIRLINDWISFTKARDSERKIKCSKCNSRVAVTISRPYLCMKCLRSKIYNDTPFPIPVIREELDRKQLDLHALGGMSEMRSDWQE